MNSDGETESSVPLLFVAAATAGLLLFPLNNDRSRREFPPDDMSGQRPPLTASLTKVPHVSLHYFSLVISVQCVVCTISCFCRWQTFVLDVRTGKTMSVSQTVKNGNQGREWLTVTQWSIFTPITIITRLKFALEVIWRTLLSFLSVSCLFAKPHITSPYIFVFSLSQYFLFTDVDLGEY